VKERRLFDWFNDRFEAALPAARSMQEAFDRVTQDIGSTHNFTPYKSFESFNKVRKRKKQVEQSSG
jgi:hypothetical protein